MGCKPIYNENEKVRNGPTSALIAGSGQGIYLYAVSVAITDACTSGASSRSAPLKVRL